MSSLTTKKAIGHAFKSLLKEKNFNKITINDIAHKCDINRQTFYYHFQDIRDLIEWICIDEVDNIFNENKKCEKWEDKFLLIFEIVLKERVFVENIYHSVSLEILRNNLYELVYSIIYNEIVENSYGKNLSEENKIFITNFYKYAFVSILLDWIDKEMIEDPKLIVLKISNLITGTINHASLAMKN